jgi:arylsulfatase B
MPHRPILLILGFIALFVFVYILFLQKESLDPPNIVIIVADDMGWADVGYHSDRVQTPNIQKLASEGIELNRFYVAPTCTPTRAGLLTGRYPIRFGMARSALAPYRNFGLPKSETTLAEALANRGYVDRGAFGKWHLGHLKPEWHPLAQGFTHFEGHYSGAIDYFSHKFYGERDWHVNYDPVEKRGYSTDLIAQAAAKFISASARKDPPYLAYIAFNSPHSPHQAKPVDLERFKTGDKEPTKETVVSAMIWSLDNGIGDVLKAIEMSGEADNTIVWFLSDNGGATGIPNNNSPLSGHKRSVYEGGIRVPAIVRWPREWPGERKVNDTMGYIDLFPTILGQVGSVKEGTQEWSTELDGINLGPIFTGSESSLSERDWYTYLGQDHPTKEWMAIKSGNWKLIVYGPPIGAAGLSRNHLLALYNIDIDPSEKNNLATKYSGRIRVLAKKLAKHRELQPTKSIGPYMTGSKQPFTPPKDWRIVPTQTGK